MTKRFRSMPATAMAAVLGLAMMTTAAAPAAAREKPKKEEPAQGPKITPSKDFMPIVQKMDEALKKKDGAALQAAITEGQGKATTNEDKYYQGFFTLQLGILNKDQALQEQGLNTALDSGFVTGPDAAVYNFFAGQFAYQKKDYAKAAQRLEAARAAGSTEASLPDVLLDSYVKSGQVDKGVAFAKENVAKMTAAGQRPSEQMFVIPARALQEANRTDEMLDILALRVQAYPNPQTWHQTLMIVLKAQGADKDRSLDTFRLMRATDALLNRNEYDEYAALATESALPGEAVAVIREGQAKKVIPKPDAKLDAVAKAQAERAGDEEATLGAYAKKPSTLSNPKVAGATGDALVGYGRAAEAIPLYQAAISGGGDKELWTYRLGVAQALTGDTAAAKASFGQIAGPRKLLAKFWLAKLDIAAAPAAPAAAAPAAPTAQPATGG
jgi:hypothetical protein